MAVAFNAVGPSSAGTATTTAATLSWTHTCTGSNLAITVGVAVGAATAAMDATTLTVTYGGVALTSLGKVHAAGATTGYVQLFGKTGVAAGSATVSVTCSATPTSMAGGSVSFTGVGSFGTAATATGTSAAPSVALTGTSAGNMVVDAVSNGSAITSSGKTNRWLNNASNATGSGNGAQSTSVSAAGAVTMSCTVASDSWGILAAEVIAAAATPVTAADPAVSGGYRGGNVTGPGAEGLVRGVPVPPADTSGGAVRSTTAVDSLVRDVVLADPTTAGAVRVGAEQDSSTTGVTVADTSSGAVRVAGQTDTAAVGVYAADTAGGPVRAGPTPDPLPVAAASSTVTAADGAAGAVRVGNVGAASTGTSPGATTYPGAGTFPGAGGGLGGDSVAIAASGDITAADVSGGAIRVGTGQDAVGVVAVDPWMRAVRLGTAVDTLTTGVTLTDPTPAATRIGSEQDTTRADVVLTDTPGVVRVGAEQDSNATGVITADAAPGPVRVGATSDTLAVGVTIADGPAAGTRVGSELDTYTAAVAAPDPSGGAVRAGNGVDQITASITVPDPLVGAVRVGSEIDAAAVGVTVGDPGHCSVRVGTSIDTLIVGVVLADQAGAATRVGSEQDTRVADVILADGPPPGTRAGTELDTATAGVTVTDPTPGAVRAGNITGVGAETLLVGTTLTDPTPAAARSGTSTDTLAAGVVLGDPGHRFIRIGTSVDTLSNPAPAPVYKTRFVGGITDGMGSDTSSWQSGTPTADNGIAGFVSGRAFHVLEAADGSSTPGTGATAPSGAYQRIESIPDLLGAAVPGVDVNGDFGPGFTGYFGLSIKLDSDFPTDPRDTGGAVAWQVISQWKNDGTGTPPFELKIGNGNQLYLDGNSGSWQTNIAPVAAGQRYNIILGVTFTESAATSTVSAWVNGTQYLTNYHPTGAGFLYAGVRSYWKTGVYRLTGIASQARVSIWYGALAFDTSRTVVANYLEATLSPTVAADPAPGAVRSTATVDTAVAGMLTNVAAPDPAAGAVRIGSELDTVAVAVTVADPGGPAGTRVGSELDAAVTATSDPAGGAVRAGTSADTLIRGVVLVDTGDAEVRAGSEIDVAAVGVIDPEPPLISGTRTGTPTGETLQVGYPDPTGGAGTRLGTELDTDPIGVTLVDTGDAEVRGYPAVDYIGNTPCQNVPGHGVEIGRPDPAYDTVTGATAGTLSNLPILRVLADFTAQAPASPALAAGGTTVDITQGMAVTKVRITRGRQYELDQVQAGTATIEFQDKQGWLNPANTASPYNSGAASLQSYRPIRIRAVWQGRSFDLFSGFVERYPLTWKNAGYHEITPMECVDHLGVLANIPIHQSYYDTVMADKPTVWIPLNDQAAPGAVSVSNPRALVANGASLPGNPRQGTSAFYQTSMLVGGTGVRVDASSSAGGQVSWGGDQMPDGTPALSLTSAISVQQGADWQLSDARARLNGGSFSLDTTGSTLEFWARMSDGDGRVFFASVQSGNYDFPQDPDCWFGLFRFPDNNYVLWVRVNAGGTRYNTAYYASPNFSAPAGADGLWHHYTISFVANAARTGYLAQFSIDGNVVTDTGTVFPALRIAINTAGAYTYTNSRLSATSAVSVFGMAYYPTPLTSVQINSHYQRGVGYVGESPRNRYGRLVNTYYAGVASSTTVEVPETLGPDFNYGVFPVPGGANDGAGITPYSVLAAIQDVDTSIAGFTYVTADGILYAPGRSRRQLGPPSIFTIGDRPDLGEVSYIDMAYDYDNSRVISQTQLSRTNGGGGSVTQSNPGSPYLKNYSQSVNVYSGFDLFQLGMFLLRRYGTQVLRVKSVVLDASVQPSLFTLIPTINLTTRVTVIRRTPTTTITGDYFVERVEHNIDSAHSEWKVTLELSPAGYPRKVGYIDNTPTATLGQTTVAGF